MPSKDYPNSPETGNAHASPNHELWREPFSTIILVVLIGGSVIFLLHYCLHVKQMCIKRKRRERRQLCKEFCYRFSLRQGRVVQEQLVIPVSSNILDLKPGDLVKITNDPAAGLYKKLEGEIVQGPRLNSTLVQVRLKHWIRANGVITFLPAYVIEKVEDITQKDIESNESRPETPGSNKKNRMSKRHRKQAIQEYSESDEEEEEEEEDEESEEVEEGEKEEEEIAPASSNKRRNSNISSSRSKEQTAERTPAPAAKEMSELDKLDAELRAERKKMSALVRDKSRDFEAKHELKKIAMRISRLQQRGVVLQKAADTMHVPVKTAVKGKGPRSLPPLQLQNMPTQALCRLCDDRGLSRQYVEGRHDLLVLLGAAKATTNQDDRLKEREEEGLSNGRKRLRRQEIAANYDKGRKAAAKKAKAIERRKLERETIRKNKARR